MKLILNKFKSNSTDKHTSKTTLFPQLFPLFFVLMTDKKTKTYQKVFKYIEDNVFKLQPAQFMADFETGLRKAITSYFPDAPLYGCWYHYSASIRRRLMTLNMHRVITDDPAGLMIYRMMLSLPLLPRERILDGFDFVKNESRKNGLFKAFKEFFKYFNEFWIHLVCFLVICDIWNFKFILPNWIILYILNTEPDKLTVRCTFKQPNLITIGIVKFGSKSFDCQKTPFSSFCGTLEILWKQEIPRYVSCSELQTATVSI